MNKCFISPDSCLLKSGLCFLLCLMLSLTSPSHGETHTGISFGSCLRQWQPQPIFASISELKPDAFIFLGDNVYSDTGTYLLFPTKRRFPRAYRELGNSQDYQNFMQSCQDNHTRVFATWDDHDYGKNDGGREFEYKAVAKQHFQQFFNIPDKQFPNTTGVYQSYWLNHGKLPVQIVLLDTRSFRSPLLRAPSNQQCPKANNGQNTDPEATILGEQQWLWLRDQLKQPAALRIIASSIQVIPREHCYEKWANFPLQREKLFDVIKQTGATGIVLISGDRHLAEISKLPAERVGYPLYEVTSSGLNSAMGESAAAAHMEPNVYRAKATNILTNNFGMIELIGNGDSARLVLQIRLEDGSIAQAVEIPLQELGFHSD